VSLGRTLLTKENLFPLTKLVNGTKRDSFSSFLDSLSK
jgi:hypothetical protein